MIYIGRGNKIDHHQQRITATKLVVMVIRLQC